MTHTITVDHNFETAHRLPHIGGKCRNLHGHSWHARVTVAADTLSGDHTVVEFGLFKKLMREWIDGRLDHGAMLGCRDVLLTPLRDDGCKVFVFGTDWRGADWPTVEAVAQMLADQATEWLFTSMTAAPDGGAAPGARITRVDVTETAVNAAAWEAQ